MNNKLFSGFLLLALLLSSSCIHAGQSARISYRGHSYDVFIADPSVDRIGFYWKNSSGSRFYSFSALRRYLERRNEKMLFATNGGIYAVGNTPLGLYIEKGQRLVRMNRNRGRGNFFVQPNGVFYLQGKRAGITLARNYNRVAGNQKRGPVTFANQSGPMLVINNRINPVFRSRSDSLYIRNAVGIDKKGRVVFVISNEAVNFYTLSRFFKNRMACHSALYLDGNISRMYLPKQGRTGLGGNFAVIFAVTRKTN